MGGIVPGMFTCVLLFNPPHIPLESFIIIPILPKQKLNNWPKVTQQESDKITYHQRLELTCASAQHDNLGRRQAGWWKSSILY